MQVVTHRDGSFSYSYRDEININPLTQAVDDLKYWIENYKGSQGVMTRAWELGRLISESGITPHGLDEAIMEMSRMLFLKFPEIKDAWKFKSVKEALAYGNK